MLTAQAKKNILESRRVLYDPDSTQHDYVEVYDKSWAHSYDQDGHDLGFQSWDYAVDRVKHFIPDKNALILDFNGGTGQVGKRLSDVGYTNLHHSDGSAAMQEKAKEMGVYKKFYTEVVVRNEKTKLLQHGHKYDCIIGCMDVSEFVTFVQQIFDEGLKPGGVFISIENVSQITDADLDGLPWLIEQAKNPDTQYEILELSDHHPYDKFTDHLTQVCVVRKKF